MQSDKLRKWASSSFMEEPDTPGSPHMSWRSGRQSQAAPTSDILLSLVFALWTEVRLPIYPIKETRMRWDAARGGRCSTCQSWQAELLQIEKPARRLSTLLVGVVGSRGCRSLYAKSQEKRGGGLEALWLPALRGCGPRQNDAASRLLVRR